MIAIAVYAFLVCYVEIEYLNLRYKSTTVVHSLLGFIISMLLVFRTNTAYDRWWEGRKNWGALLNLSRNLSMKVVGMYPKDRVKPVSEHIINYAYVLKEHLRGHKTETILQHNAALKPSLEQYSDKTHLPNAIAAQLHLSAIQLYKDGHIAAEQHVLLTNDINQFTEICGACERIKKTPIPFSYSLFIKKFIFFYTITMPLSFVTDFRYWTIPITVFVFYALTSLELIAEEIEDPFGKDANDLPTDEISANIKRSVEEISGIGI